MHGTGVSMYLCQLSAVNTLNNCALMLHVRLLGKVDGALESHTLRLTTFLFVKVLENNIRSRIVVCSTQDTGQVQCVFTNASLGAFYLHDCARNLKNNDSL